METTNPINGNDLEAVADSLIMNTPNNSDGSEDEAIAATGGDQPEVVEAEDQDQDDAVAASSEYDDSEEYEEAEQNEVDQEPVFTVKVDGQEQEVTLDELKRGYSGQKYIQKGMAEAAEMRKQIEQMQQETSQRQQMLNQMINQVQQNGIPVVPEYPSEELRESDPLGFLEAEANYRRAVEKRQQWDNQQRYLAQQQAAQEQQMNNQFLEQQAMRLAEWMPEFADPEKRTVFVQEMSSKAKKHYNLTDEQIGTVKTAEEVMILNDALKWRELQAKTGQAQKKAQGARPVVQPAAKRAASTGKANQAKKAKSAMKRTGSPDDVANWLLS